MIHYIKFESTEDSESVRQRVGNRGSEYLRG